MAEFAESGSTKTPIWSDRLEGAPLAIAASTAGRLRVSAGPGTGKTFALMRRVSRILEEGAEPSRVFLVTYTRTAARDLKENLRALGVPGAKDIRAQTLHRFCLDVLSRSGVLEVTGRHPRLLMDFEERFLLEDLKTLDRGVRDGRKLLAAFEAAWARFQRDEPGWPNLPAEQAFERDLLAWLRFHQAMLVGELVTATRDYLRQNPHAVERAVFDHVLVDEYQDLNRADQDVIAMLAENGDLAIIGDEDQSIYANLRHAQPEGIGEFGARHAGTEDHSLDVCHRCPQLVVDLANALISHNAARKPRILYPKKDNPAGEVSVVQWATAEEEAEGIADFVARYLERPDTQPKDVLVLAPRRAIGQRIRDAIRNHGISAISYFFEEALDDAYAQERFTLLALLVDPDDRVALRCWLGFGLSGFGAAPYRRLREYCLAHGVVPREAMDAISRGEVAFSGSDRLKERYELLQTELTALDGLIDHPLADQLFPDGDERLATVRQAAKTVLERAATETEVNAAKLLAGVRSRVIDPEPAPADSNVRVMSLHKSKGLTAKVVVVAGCVEGCVPSLDDDPDVGAGERDLEEQRRVFYVALTRPREILVLSSFAEMSFAEARRSRAEILRRNGDRATVAASRFLGELGPTAPTPTATLA